MDGGARNGARELGNPYREGKGEGCPVKSVGVKRVVGKSGTISSDFLGEGLNYSDERSLSRSATLETERNSGKENFTIELIPEDGSRTLQMCKGQAKRGLFSLRNDSLGDLRVRDL